MILIIVKYIALIVFVISFIVFIKKDILYYRKRNKQLQIIRDNIDYFILSTICVILPHLVVVVDEKLLLFYFAILLTNIAKTITIIKQLHRKIPSIIEKISLTIPIGIVTSFFFFSIINEIIFKIILVLGFFIMYIYGTIKLNKYINMFTQLNDEIDVSFFKKSRVFVISFIICLVIVVLYFMDIYLEIRIFLIILIMFIEIRGRLK